MGQSVEIRDAVDLGDTLLIDTDRSFTGQDGQEITMDLPGTAVPGLLAADLFELGIGIDYVFVLQNTVSVRRPVGWDPDAIDRVKNATTSFLRYYGD
ncbi:MAG TPA: hypothetical protein VIW94_10690 [Acidimicrobiia bacterium]